MSAIYINVHLKREILDPQGRAIYDALKRLGLEGINEVRQGKQFVIEFDGNIESDQINYVQDLAENLLSNPVIENFTVEVKE